MTSIVTDKLSQFCKIPSEMLDDNSFIDAYKELLNTELDKRIDAVLKSNYKTYEKFLNCKNCLHLWDLLKHWRILHSDYLRRSWDD
jgi:hypothetical protein